MLILTFFTMRLTIQYLLLSLLSTPIQGQGKGAGREEEREERERRRVGRGKKNGDCRPSHYSFSLKVALRSARHSEGLLF